MHLYAAEIALTLTLLCKKKCKRKCDTLNAYIFLLVLSNTCQKEQIQTVTAIEALLSDTLDIS